MCTYDYGYDFQKKNCGCIHSRCVTVLTFEKNNMTDYIIEIQLVGRDTIFSAMSPPCLAKMKEEKGYNKYSEILKKMYS